MSKKVRSDSGSDTKAGKKSIPGVEHIQEKGGINEYRLKSNGLSILHVQIPDTGVITTNITYRVGARDEARGETGLAHMLEHMLFKPTERDLKQKIDSGAMQFERDTGCILNANTWKDRTTYFFNYPKEHIDRALTIEADRMENVIINDKEFQPERGNVLSEFDMYFGMPEFALEVSMVGTAFLSHPYGHETIGTREDIEDYTVEKLQNFYRNYYRPDNATMMVIGDIDAVKTQTLVKKYFNDIKNPDTPIPRIISREPKQEGRREVVIRRPSSTNILAVGVKHDGFPTRGWLETLLAFGILAEGPESILHKKLVDTGKATALKTMQEPTVEMNMGVLLITLASPGQHEVIEKEILETINDLSTKDIANLVKKEVAHQITMEEFARASSLGIASNLTEYVAAGDWTAATTHIDMLKQVTPTAVLERINELFREDQLTIGKFIGTN